MNMIKLTDAEWEVMKVLWDKGELPLSQIVEELHRREITWVQNTVHTLITRLAKKEIVYIEKDKTPFRYGTIVDRNTCEQRQTKEFVDKVFNGSVSKLVSALLGSDNISNQELELLEKIISESRGEK